MADDGLKIRQGQRRTPAPDPARPNSEEGAIKRSRQIDDDEDESASSPTPPPNVGAGALWVATFWQAVA